MDKKGTGSFGLVGRNPLHIKKGSIRMRAGNFHA